MQGTERFFQQNRNRMEEYPASRRFADENGEPLMWKIRVISGGEDEMLREACTKVMPSSKSGGFFFQGMDQDEYTAKLAAYCTVCPDLKDTALQQAYGTHSAEELLGAMLDIEEYEAYLVRVQEVNDF